LSKALKARQVQQALLVPTVLTEQTARQQQSRLEQ
jgi:hypothetical protein